MPEAVPVILLGVGLIVALLYAAVLECRLREITEEYDDFLSIQMQLLRAGHLDGVNHG